VIIVFVILLAVIVIFVFVRQGGEPDVLFCWKKEKKYSGYVGSFGQRVDDNNSFQQVGSIYQRTNGGTGEEDLHHC
jgi:hypothetical protein